MGQSEDRLATFVKAIPTPSDTLKAFPFKEVIYTYFA